VEDMRPLRTKNVGGSPRALAFLSGSSHSKHSSRAHCHSVLDPILASPYGPRRVKSRTLRPDTRQHLITCSPKERICLHLPGRPHTSGQRVGLLALSKPSWHIGAVEGCPPMLTHMRKRDPFHNSSLDLSALFCRSAATRCAAAPTT
jgi:hypothetical protein